MSTTPEINEEAQEGVEIQPNVGGQGADVPPETSGTPTEGEPEISEEGAEIQPELGGQGEVPSPS